MRKRNKSRNKAVQELDMTEHAQRLRSIPGGPGEMIKTILVWVAAGVTLGALVWLTMGR